MMAQFDLQALLYNFSVFALGAFASWLLFSANSRFGSSGISKFVRYCAFGVFFFSLSQGLGAMAELAAFSEEVGFLLEQSSASLGFAFFFFASLEFHDISEGVAGGQ